MAAKTITYGMALQNFTAAPRMPDPAGLIDYAVRMEELGFDSVWVWDHILLGTEPCFPIIDALTLLTAIAVRTSKIELGTGILILPVRNPVLLAKQLGSMDQISGGRLILGMAAGWYKREFDALGVDFKGRGKIMEQNLDILTRLWTEDSVTLNSPPYELRQAVMSPKPVRKPRPTILIGGYVDRVLKRAGEKGDGWLTYFYTAQGFTKSWTKVKQYAEDAGRDPETLISANQLPIMVGKSKSEVREPMEHWLKTEWDFASWSDSTMDSAIMGSADECVEQLQAHIDAGCHKLIFVPYKYDMEQVDIIAREIIPKLRPAG